MGLEDTWAGEWGTVSWREIKDQVGPNLQAHAYLPRGAFYKPAHAIAWLLRSWAEQCVRGTRETVPKELSWEPRHLLSNYLGEGGELGKWRCHRLKLTKEEPQGAAQSLTMVRGMFAKQSVSVSPRWWSSKSNSKVMRMNKPFSCKLLVIKHKLILLNEKENPTNALSFRV